MATLQDYINQVRALVHDTNSADFTNSTLINFINQARTRVAMDTHCVRQFFGAGTGNALNTIPQQEIYPYTGAVGGANVTAGGSGYTSAPAVTVTGGGGSGATAKATILNGAVTAVDMTNWGAGYTSAPTLGFTGGGGTGAAATAIALVNVLDILSITTIWGDERIMHEWMPFSMFQTWCRQLTNQFNVPSLFTMHQGTLKTYLFQIPDQVYAMEWDVITLPNDLVNLADADNQVIAPWNDAVQLFAAHLCMASLQNFDMADYWYSGMLQKPGKYDSRVRQLPATAFERRIYNPYRTFQKRLRRM